MPTVTTSTVLDAPPPEVWALLRDFAAISSWHPYLPACEIEHGPADRVGCTRVFPAAGGHRETLTGLDDRARTIAYAFDDDGGLPVRDYRCELRVDRVTDTGRTFVAWTARFDCDADDEEKAVAQVRDFLVPGLAALAHRFAPAA